MGVTRLKRKNRKDKAKSSRRRTDLKNQNFQPVLKSVDVEEIKKTFKKDDSRKKGDSNIIKKPLKPIAY